VCNLMPKTTYLDSLQNLVCNIVKCSDNTFWKEHNKTRNFNEKLNLTQTVFRCAKQHMLKVYKNFTCLDETLENPQISLK